MNHEEWHKWRRQGIGSSDAPIICGVSPWSTPYQLWERKTGRITREESNWATRKGHEMEPRARAHYELLNGIDMPPTLAQHSSIPWLRASLDGYNNGVVLEIKCPSRKDHETAINGRIPEKYYPQVQHQLAVTGASRVDYFSFHEGNGVTVSVTVDSSFLIPYLVEAADFWWLVEKDIPPSLVQRDWKLNRSKELRKLVEDWEGEGDQDRKENIEKIIFTFTNEKSQRIRTLAGYHIDGGIRKIIAPERRKPQ